MTQYAFSLIGGHQQHLDNLFTEILIIVQTDYTVIIYIVAVRILTTVLPNKLFLDPTVCQYSTSIFIMIDLAIDTELLCTCIYITV